MAKVFGHCVFGCALGAVLVVGWVLATGHRPSVDSHNPSSASVSVIQPTEARPILVETKSNSVFISPTPEEGFIQNQLSPRTEDSTPSMIQPSPSDNSVIYNGDTVVNMGNEGLVIIGSGLEVRQTMNGQVIRCNGIEVRQTMDAQFILVGGSVRIYQNPAGQTIQIEK